MVTIIEHEISTMAGFGMLLLAGEPPSTAAVIVMFRGCRRGGGACVSQARLHGREPFFRLGVKGEYLHNSHSKIETHRRQYGGTYHITCA